MLCDPTAGSRLHNRPSTAVTILEVATGGEAWKAERTNTSWPRHFYEAPGPFLHKPLVGECLASKAA